MDIQKLLQKPQEEEIIFTATEAIRLANLSVSSGVGLEKLGTIVLKRNELRSSLATFSIPVGGFQRNLLSLLNNPLQLEEGDSLILRVTPALSGDEDWVGVSGFAYPAGSGTELPGDLTGQLTAIEQAIDEVRTEVSAIPNDFDAKLTAIQDAIIELPTAFDAKLTAIQNAIVNLQMAGSGRSEAFVYAALADFEKHLISKSLGWYRHAAGNWGQMIPTWNSGFQGGEQLALVQQIVFGPFDLENRLNFYLGGGLTTRPNLKLWELRDSANSLLMSGQCMNLVGVTDNAPVYPTAIDTSAYAGTLGAKLIFLDNDTTVPSGGIQVSAEFQIT